MNSQSKVARVVLNRLLSIFLFITILSPILTSANTQYQPTSIEEINAQYQLLIELNQDYLISKDVFIDKSIDLKNDAKEK